MADKVTVVYDGPNAAHAAVDVHDPLDGSLIEQNVVRGQSIDVDKHVAESLLESGNFKKPEPAKVQKDDR
jgi:hypothetical protein